MLTLGATNSTVLMSIQLFFRIFIYCSTLKKLQVIKDGAMCPILKKAENFTVFVKLIQLWYNKLQICKCIPSTTKHFIIPINTRYMFRSYWSSSGTIYITVYLKIKIKCIYTMNFERLLKYMMALHFNVFCFKFLYSMCIYIYIYIHFILRFRYHTCNAWRISV
jgi:hypothetical protein